MRKIHVITILLFVIIASVKTQSIVEFTTNLGVLKVKLYDETPMHKDNFLELVEEKYYDSILFHRVIPNFMIQAGDPMSKKAKPGAFLGSGGKQYTIPAEFNPKYIHKKGALAAARQGDNVNPQKESSGSQFYIVQGRTFTDEELDMIQKQYKRIPFTPEQREIYKTIGGTPHLDYSYTVFGEVIEGLDIVDLIASQATDRNNRPITDVRILKTRLLK